MESVPGAVATGFNRWNRASEDIDPVATAPGTDLVTYEIEPFISCNRERVAAVLNSKSSRNPKPR